MDMNNNEKKCKKCKDVLTGVKYFENKNKVKDVLCYFCLCKILKTKVGDNAGRIQEQLRWLDQHKQKSYLSQWNGSGSIIMQQLIIALKTSGFNNKINKDKSTSVMFDLVTLLTRMMYPVCRHYELKDWRK